MNVLNMKYINSTLEELSGWKVDHPTTSESFDFEAKHLRWIAFQTHKLNYLAYYLAFAYIFAIFVLQQWMQKRQAFDLKVVLFLWNAVLAFFSIVVFVRLVPGHINMLSRENGFYNSICIREGINPQTCFWGFLFLLSKPVEFGDTIFIILRKRPLIFIHWYHHLMTMIVSWMTAQYMEPIIRWHGFLNSGVHSVMYPYFAAKAIGMNVPVMVKKFITTIQFVQMLICLGIHLTTFYLKGVNGNGCVRETNSILAYIFMFITYTFLFGRLFYRSITAHKSRSKEE